MKKSLLALAVLSAFAGAASAQSSVTVYGRVDLSLAQQADAVKDREIRNGSGSRLGFRGVEDLGGGLKAVFQIEHRFNADTGTQSVLPTATSTANRFWEGKSVVGLEGGFGRVLLGREENPAYTFGQTPADPWGTDTVAANTTIINGRVGSTRYSDSVNYRFSAAGFSFGAQIAEAAGNPVGDAQKRPYSLGAAYAAGPIFVGVGFENPSDTDDRWTSINGSYNLGFVKLGAFYGSGKNTAAQKVQSYLVGASVPLGGGELRASYGELKNKDLSRKLDKQAGLGYHYFLSKRTTVYGDFVSERRDNMAANLEKNGFDLGIKHNF